MGALLVITHNGIGCRVNSKKIHALMNEQKTLQPPSMIRQHAESVKSFGTKKAKNFQHAAAKIGTIIASRNRFDAFFKKPNELIMKLTKDRMEEWKTFLLADGRLAAATVAGTIQKTKTVFNWAKQQKWLVKCPLEGLNGGSFRNSAKDRYVLMGEYHRLLAACPCQEWRVIITLARIGGLRPCEIMVLRWSDIGIGEKQDRVRVFSPKLHRHEHLREPASEKTSQRKKRCGLYRTLFLEMF